MIDSLKVQQRMNWIFVAVWMLLIFGFSGQNAELSSEVSGGLVDLVAEGLRAVMAVFFHDSMTVDISLLTYLIRKGAHFFLYTVLGVLVSLALCPEGKINKRIFLTTLLICFLYACSDEYHQLFVSGRSCEWGDVCIDTSGSALGIGLTGVLKSVTAQRKCIKRR